MNLLTWTIYAPFLIGILSAFCKTVGCKKNLGFLCKFVKQDGTPRFKRCNDKIIFHRQRRAADSGGASVLSNGTFQFISITPAVVFPYTSTWSPISPSPSSSQKAYSTQSTSLINQGFPGPGGVLPGPGGSLPGPSNPGFPGPVSPPVSIQQQPFILLEKGFNLSKYNLSLILMRPTVTLDYTYPFENKFCQEFHQPVVNCDSGCPGNVTDVSVNFVTKGNQSIAHITWSPPTGQQFCKGYFLLWAPIERGAPYEKSLFGTRCKTLTKDTFHYEIMNSTDGWKADDILMVLVKALPTTSSKQLFGAHRFDPRVKECFDPTAEDSHAYFKYDKSVPNVMANNSTAKASCISGFYLWMDVIWHCVLSPYGQTYWEKSGMEPLCLTKEEFSEKCRKERNAPLEVIGNKLKCGELESNVTVSVVLGIISGVLLIVIMVLIQYRRYVERRSTQTEDETGISNAVLEGHCWVLYHPDSRKFVDEVWRFTTWLRKNGFNAVMDKMNTDRLQLGPARWCEIQMAKSTKILVLCSRGFLKMCNLDTTEDFQPEHLTPDEKMSLSQISLVRQSLFDSGGRSEKIVPILVQDSKEGELPPFLKTLIMYRWPDDHESILCRIVDNPEYAV